MNVTGVFISRPVMTTLVMLGIVLFGIAGYRALPVSDLPNVDFPTLQVYANLPGASPETMAASVATPLERQFSTIPGLDSMTSSSSRGSTNVTLQFCAGALAGCRRTRRAIGHRRRAAATTARHAQPADLPKGESGRPAHPQPFPQLPHPTALRGG